MTSAELQATEGLTLSRPAQRLGCPVSTAHGWLHGTRRPDWSSLRRIVEATGGSVSAADFKTASHELAPDRDHLPSIHGFAETQAPLAAEAQSLGLDASAIAAKAVREAISAEKGRRLLEENRDAIEAWNRWAETNELPLAEYRMF